MGQPSFFTKFKTKDSRIRAAFLLAGALALIAGSGLAGKARAVMLDGGSDIGCSACSNNEENPSMIVEVHTEEALKAQKPGGCVSKGTCTVVKYEYTADDGTEYDIYDCVGDGCGPTDKEDPAGGGSSFSCGWLAPARCQELVPLYSKNSDPFLARGWGVLSKVLTKNFSNFAADQADVNLYDDLTPRYIDKGIQSVGTVGLTDNFFQTPDYVFLSKPSCVAQFRSNAYVYIPQGWRSFGLKANQSLTTGDNSCYYCRANEKGCPANNSQITWSAAKQCTYEDENGRLRTQNLPLTCSCDDVVGVKTAAGTRCSVSYGWDDCSPDGSTHGCRFDCRGALYTWMAAQGSGSQANPYVPNPVVAYDADWDPNPLNKRKLAYSYTWQGQASGETQPPSRMTDDVVESGWVSFAASANPETVNLNLGTKKAIDKIVLYFENTITTGSGRHSVSLGNCASPLIEVFCDGQLAGYNNFGAVGGGLATFSTVPLLKNCQNLTLKLHHAYVDNVGYKPLKLSEIDVYGWNALIEDTGFLNPGHLEANFTRFNNWFKLVSLNLAGISGSEAQAAGAGVDTAWSSPRYFGGGWYPIQTSKKLDLFLDQYYAFPIYQPQLWWRKCLGSSLASCDQGERYANGSPGGAAISACEPGKMACRVNPAATTPTVEENTSVADLVIATIDNYVTGSDSLRVTEFSDPNNLITLGDYRIDEASKQVKVDVTAGEVTAGGTVTLQVTAKASDKSLCEGNVGIQVVPSRAWWQVKDGDIMTNGDLVSPVPANKFFELEGLGGYPGIPIYGGETDLNTDNVSAPGWLADSLSPVLNTKVFNYAYFAKRIPDEVAFTSIVKPEISGSLFMTGEESFGYSWYKFEGAGVSDLTIKGDIHLGSRKVILLVDSADLYLKGKINLTGGKGFFLAIVGGSGPGSKGNIRVDPAVGGSHDANPELEGLFLADNRFHTGTAQVGNDSQLHLRGAVAAYGGIDLERNLGAELNSTTPAELFEYAPGLTLLFPPKLSARKMRWKEVLP